MKAHVAERAALTARDAEADQRRRADQRAEQLAWEDYINRVNRAYREAQEDNISLEDMEIRILSDEAQSFILRDSR